MIGNKTGGRGQERCPLQDPEFASILLEYCDRVLAPETAKTLEAHFEVCSACREAVEAQRAVWTALDEFKPEHVGGDFDKAVLARVEGEARSARRMPWSRMLAFPRLPAGPAIPMAAAALVLMAVALFRPGVPGETEDGARFLKSDLVVDVEQVDRSLDDMEMLRQLGLASNEEVEPRTL
ncbi:MAG: zf-HC2 domain-containing protein [Bryobacteraceae bacterium]